MHLVPARWPHKLLSASIALSGAPELDRLVEKRAGVRLDWFFSPNLHFTALSGNVRHILMVHDLTFHLFKNYFTPRQRLWHRLVNPKKQCQTAGRVIAPSENTKRDLVDHYQIPAEKITVLYPGLSSSFDMQHSSSDTQRKYSLPENYILFLGAIEPRKNIPAIIQAFEESCPSLPASYSLVIAGAPASASRRILARIKASPRLGQIRLIGYVDHRDKPALYRGASLFVYPSFYEGFGFPALEAMAAGVPVIASNRSSLPEVTGAAAFLVNPHRPDEIAEGIRRLLTDAAARAAAIKSGRERAARFSWEKTAQDALALFSSV